MRIAIITTGGTIDKLYFDASSEFEVGDPQVGRILEEALVGVEHRIQPLMQKDSLEMDEADRARIREAVLAAPEQRVLITHGTDTMTATAEALGDVADKVVVLTGSLSPARFRSTDAVFNVGLAFGALQTAAPGVYLAMNGEIFRAGEVRKDKDANRFRRG